MSSSIESELSGITCTLRDIAYDMRQIAANAQRQPVEAVLEERGPSALELLAEAVLEGRVSVTQHMPTRNSGKVKFEIVVADRATS